MAAEVELDESPNVRHHDRTDEHEHVPGSLALDTAQDDVSVSSARHVESGRKRTCVLLGSAILQLPIWGRSHALSACDSD